MSVTPYGYTVANGKAVLNKAEAQQVRVLYEEYISGASMQAAAVKAGINRVHGTLGKILDNPLYKGDSFYPAIVGKELWEKAQDERKRRAYARGWNKNIFPEEKGISSPFWNMVFCSGCGSIYRRYTDSGKERWRCSRRNQNNSLCCDNPMFTENELEMAVMHAVGQINIDEISAKLNKTVVEFERIYDDPFRQAEYVYSQTQIDDFEYQTNKLITTLENIPAGFDGEFTLKIIKRIEVTHGGTLTIEFINGRECREELKTHANA